jgi:hypothetical protein
MLAFLQFLPVYVPSEAEKNDAVLFARNVRAKMAEYVLLVHCVVKVAVRLAFAVKFSSSAF